jgi:hypothetical protein
MYPDPDSEMWFPWVEQLLHPSFEILRHLLELGMVNPMLRSIFSEGKFLQATYGDRFVQV